MRKLLLSAIILSSIIIYSCDLAGVSGDFNENLPPRTFLAVDEVNLPSGERLSSQVRIRWWGDDPDGYVDGYEYCLGDKTACNWIDAGATTDTLFVLPIPEGADVADVVFNVRAYDNEGLRDPKGATAVFPIKNSPPTIEFNNIELPPDTTYHFVAFGWSADDPDGFDNLNYIEVAINDTLTSDDWLRLPVDINYIGLALNNSETAVTDANVFTGRGLSTSDLVMKNLRPEERNTIFIRSVDNSLAVSKVDTVSWYLKRQKSKVLFLFDDDRSAGRNALPTYLNLLADAGFDNIDFWDISDGEVVPGQGVFLSRALPQQIDPTLQRTLADWDYIYWLSNNLQRNITYATQATQRLIAQGGSVFVNIPTSRLEDDHPAITFLPIQKMADLVPGTSSYGIPNNAYIAPPASITAFDTLYTSSGLINVFPIDISSDMQSVLTANFVTRPSSPPGTQYPREISSLNEERTVGYFGILLNSVRGFSLSEPPTEQELVHRENLVNYLRYILIDELGFEQ